MEDLVRAAQKGDALAMSMLLTELAPYVGRICGAIALDDGEDAAQEALVAVFRRLGTLREPAALRGWARAIAAREAVRVARRRAAPAAALPEALPSPQDVEVAADIRDLLARLRPEQRAVLVLRDVEGLEEAEAAALLNVPVGTVKSRLHRARAAFRREWAS
jgi:RNA polymerase sigma factor (sigma-70 family)